MSDIYRNLSSAGLTASQWTARVNATMNAAFGYSLGRLQVTNSDGDAITADLLHAQGFTALQDGALMWLIPAANNTGPVTIDIGGIGTVALRDPSGVALAADVLVAGKAVLVGYNDAAGHLRIMSTYQVTGSTTGVPPYSAVAEILSNGSWVAPWDCYVRATLQGPGGGGGCSANTAGGGGAGGRAIKRDFFMESGQQLDAVIASPGVGHTYSGAIAGTDGGNSTVTGPNGLSMQANGGKGGAATNSGVTSLGGDGGTATGGDLNITGQKGTDATPSDHAGAGGCLGLLSTPSQQAANTLTGQHAITDFFTVVRALGVFTADSPMSGGDGSLANLPAPAGDGDPGCGGGANGGDAGTSGDGGASYLTIEYTGPVT